MSYLWWFSSFSPVAFKQLLAGEHPQELDAFVARVASSFDALEAAPEDAEIARKLLASGFSYEGFDRRTARTADEIVASAFSDDGLRDVLEIKPLSPDGVHPSVIEELIARTDPSILPSLVTGRRFGEDGPAPCEYCILSPEEVALALDEIGRAVSVPVPWSTKYVPDLVRECLIEPLTIGMANGRWIFGALG